MKTTATELFETLKQFNKGVKGVSIEYGIVCVAVTSKRAVQGVTLDLLRSRAFRSVVATVNNVGGGFTVNAVPA